jgi:UDP-N-acetyl-D-mannosaminuronic acid dehydrogenase
MKKICVIGLGYIGIPTSIIAAEHGFEVAGFDVDVDKVKRLNNKDSVIDEPECGARLAGVVEEKSFVAHTKVQPADCFVICVPTPLNNKKQCDLSYVYSAVDKISEVIEKGNLVLLESTVPVGTSEAVAKYLEQKTGLKRGQDFYFAFCPERVLPGKIFYELVYNSRIVGGINRKSSELAKQFYGRFVKGDVHYDVDASSAEMVKLIENSYRDVNIAFAHQVAGMAESVSLDPYGIIELANKHPRVNILTPTCGVGGHCISIDPWFLTETFPNDTQLLVSARQINNARPFEILKQIQKRIKLFKKENSKPCKVAVLGLTYKPDVDDLRESPALFIAEQLKMYKDINLMVVEPNVEANILNKYFDLTEIYDIKKALKAADIIVSLVAHSPFKSIDITFIEGKELLDCCKLFKKPQVSNMVCDWQAKERNETGLS